nr:ISAs1 family transposase [Endozoicomonas sp.]
VRSVWFECSFRTSISECDNLEIYQQLSHISSFSLLHLLYYSSPAFAESTEINRGRYEHRRCWVFNNIDDIDPKHEWPGLKQFSVIQRDRLIGKKQTTEVHCYIESREMTASSVLAAVRNHWSIENGQHLSLDVSFKEDASKIHERTAAKNVATVRRWCFNAHKLSSYFEKESMAGRIELAGLDQDYRTKLVLEQFYPD